MRFTHNEIISQSIVVEQVLWKNFLARKQEVLLWASKRFSLLFTIFRGCEVQQLFSWFEKVSEEVDENLWLSA